MLTRRAASHRRCCQLFLLTLMVALTGCSRQSPDETPESTAAPAAAASGKTAGPDGIPDAGGKEEPGGPVVEAAPGTPEHEVHAALDGATWLLKTGDYRGYYEKYAPEDEYEILKTDTRLFDFVLESMKTEPERVEYIINLIDKARRLQPQIDESGTRAEFYVGDPQIKDGGEAVAAGAYEVELTETIIAGLGGDLPSAIDEALALLEAGELRQFIDGMFPVGMLRHPDSEQMRQQIVARLKANPAPVEQMIADFKAIKSITPAMEDSGKVAVYELPGPAADGENASGGPPSRTIRFQQVDTFWRLADHSRPAHDELIRQSSLPTPAEEKKPLLVMLRVDKAWRIHRYSSGR